MEPTATVTARDRVQARPSSGTPTTHDNTPRFLVQFGRTILKTDTLCLPDTLLLRGEITPLTGFQRAAHINTIPEGNIVAGSRTSDRDGREIYARELVYAGPEAERLLDIEAQTERKDGLVEIKSLHNRMDVYEAVDFNKVFFPDGLDKLPVKHDAMKAHLEARKAAIGNGGLVPNAYRDLALDVADEMIKAVAYVNTIQNSRLEEAHRWMKLPPNDASGLFKKGYDDVDEEMLLRTGKPRFDASDDMTAEALQLLSKGGQTSTDALLAALVEQNQLMREQMAQQSQQLTRALEAMTPVRETPAAVPVQTAQTQENKQPRRSPFTDK